MELEYKDIEEINITDPLIKELLEIAIGDQDGEPRIYFYDEASSGLTDTEIRGITFEFGLIAGSRRAAALGMMLIMLLERNRRDFWYGSMINDLPDTFSLREFYNELVKHQDLTDYDLTDTFITKLYRFNFEADETIWTNYRKTIIDVGKIYTLQTIWNELFPNQKI